MTEIIDPLFLSMVNSLATNFAIILGTMVFYFVLLDEVTIAKPKVRSLVTGIGFGVFCIISMLAPTHQSEGISIDARFILTMLSTVYGGPISGITTAIMAAIFRLIKGGVGFYAANPALAASILVGLLFLYLNIPKDQKFKRMASFFLAAVLLFFCQVISGLTFLWFFPWEHVKQITWYKNLPALVVYPPMAFLMGIGLDFVASRHQLLENQKHFIKVLERHNRELHVFNSALHHEFRTPIVNLGGYLSELRMHLKENNPQEIESDLNILQRATDQLSSLVVALTRFNKAGAMGLQQPNSLSSLLESIKVHWPFIHILNSMDASIKCGHNEFQEIITAVIENAVKFKSPDRDLTVSISLSMEGKMIRLDIRDNGIGMDNYSLKSAFHLFQRGKASSDGIGASLAITKRMVESIQGQILVHSEGIHQGCTVSIWFPLDSQT